MIQIRKSDKVKFRLTYETEGHPCTVHFNSFASAAGTAEALKREGRVMLMSCVISSFEGKLLSDTYTHVYSGNTRRILDFDLIEQLLEVGKC